MKFGVLVALGGAVVEDVTDVLSAEGSTAEFLGPGHTDLDGVDAVIIPNGLVTADIVASPVLAAIRRFAGAGGPVLGIGNGFRVLCESGLLDGAVEPLELERGEVHCVVEGRPTPFTQAIPAGRHLRMALDGGGGRFTHADVDALESESRVVLRYCTSDGEVTRDANPSASVANIAGICNAAGNVVGLVPQPERSLFLSAAAWKTGTPARVS